MYPHINIFNLQINNHALLIFIAMVTFGILLKRELRRNAYPEYSWAFIMTAGVAGGLIGAKLYHCFEEWYAFVSDPAEILFNIHGSGWYGGFMLGLIFILIVLKLKKLPALATLDIIATIVPLGQVFGRLGCFLAGCCGGVQSKSGWAMAFPNGIITAPYKIHPTQLYEMLIYLCVFILLWNLRKKEVNTGVRFGLYLILAGLGRFVIEFYRINPDVLLGFSAQQIIAISGVLAGLLIITAIRFKGTRFA